MGDLSSIIKSTLSKITKNGIVHARESSVLEFKESFNYLAIPDYTKILASFANNKGGIIIFGISNSPKRVVGIDVEKFDEIKQEKITSFLLDHISPNVDWALESADCYSGKLGILSVQEALNKPVICINNSGTILRNGEVYFRYRAQSKRIQYAELKGLIDRIKSDEKKYWMSLFSQIAQVGPSNAAVLNLINGTIKERGGTIVIDESTLKKVKFIKEGMFNKKGSPTLKLIGDVVPVKDDEIRHIQINLTKDPKAPALRLNDAEILKYYPITYYELIRELRKKYDNFKQNNDFHKIRKAILAENETLTYTRYLNPNNPKSGKKVYYSRDIVDYFYKYYQ